MNIAYGQSMLTNARPYRYREGAPEIVLNHIGVNDIAIAFGNKFGHRPSTAYLADAIAAWLGQVRAVCGPTSHIVLVEPLAYQHIYPHLTADSEKIDAVKAQYGKGIADYRAANPDDHRIHHVVLGKTAAEAALSHNGVPYPSSSIHFRPDASQAIGQELADQLAIILE